MADKEILYRIEFEGAKEQVKVLADIREIREELTRLSKLNLIKADKVRQEELKIAAKQKQDQYRAEQQAIKDSGQRPKSRCRFAGRFTDKGKAVHKGTRKTTHRD